MDNPVRPTADRSTMNSHHNAAIAAETIKVSIKPGSVSANLPITSGRRTQVQRRNTRTNRFEQAIATVIALHTTARPPYETVLHLIALGGLRTRRGPVRILTRPGVGGAFLYVS